MINFQEEFLKDQEDDLRILVNPVYFGPGPDDDDDDDEDEDWDDEDEIDEDDEIEDIDDEEHVDPNIMDDEEDDEDLIGGRSESAEKTEEAKPAPQKGEKHVTEADKIEREDLGEEFELPHRHHRPFVSHEPGTLPEED